MFAALTVLTGTTTAFVLPTRTSVPTMTMTSTVNEEHAKLKWLAKLDTPTWGTGVVTPTSRTSAQASDDYEAKKAWLARLDEPGIWGRATALVADIAEEALVMEAASEDIPAAKMSEEEAKVAWLAKLDVPSWGKAVAAMSAVETWIAQETGRQQISEEEAKKAWLSKLDAPSWGEAALVMTTVAQEASNMQEMTAACESGDDLACTSLSNEEVAKKQWLAKLDVPTWGAAAAAVSVVAKQVGA